MFGCPWGIPLGGSPGGSPRGIQKGWKIPLPRFRGFDRKKVRSLRGRPDVIVRWPGFDGSLYSRGLRTQICPPLALGILFLPKGKAHKMAPEFSKKGGENPHPGFANLSTKKIVSGSQRDISEAPGAKFAAVALTRRRGRCRGRAEPWGPVFPDFSPNGMGPGPSPGPPWALCGPYWPLVALLLWLGLGMARLGSGLAWLGLSWRGLA